MEIHKNHWKHVGVEDVSNFETITKLNWPSFMCDYGMDCSLNSN